MSFTVCVVMRIFASVCCAKKKSAPSDHLSTVLRFVRPFAILQPISIALLVERASIGVDLWPTVIGQLIRSPLSPKDGILALLHPDVYTGGGIILVGVLSWWTLRGGDPGRGG